MRRYEDVVQSTQGLALAGASVNVYLAGGTTPATIYSDDGSTVTSNPLTTDANGRFGFYVADGKYDLRVSGTGITTYTYSNIEIADITETNTTDTNWSAQQLNLTKVLDFGPQASSPGNSAAGHGRIYFDTNTNHLLISENAGAFSQLNLGGTVTSIAMTVPGEFSLTGSPITTSGTLAITKATQVANQVYAGPTSGGAAQPTFRALVAADIAPIVTYKLESVNTTPASNSAGTTATITSYTLPANEVTTGQILRILMHGTYANNTGGNATNGFVIKLNATTIATGQLNITTANTATFRFESVVLCVAGGSSGTFEFHALNGPTTAPTCLISAATTAIDWTTTNTIAVAPISAVGSTTLTCRSLVIERLG